jgi:hypothetical protein
MLQPRKIRRLKLRAIRDLERAIRVWELVAERTQQIVNEKTACHEKQGGAVDINPTVDRARANIAAYNRAILGAKARIDKLERAN